jgi:hypothetical protein
MKFLFQLIIFISICLHSHHSIAVNDSLTEINYLLAFQHIEKMLSNENTFSFENAIYLIENAYCNNTLSKASFINTIDFHANRIIQFSNANKFRLNRVDSIYLNKPGINTISKEEKEKTFNKVLLNWAIYTYLTDTTYWKQNDGSYLPQYPITYNTADPFGSENWENTMVSNLILTGNEYENYSRQKGGISSTNDPTEKVRSSLTKKGNCFSMAALFYIFSLRLQSDACLVTAPQHLYIQHKGFDGDYYNIELTTKSFPGSGTIKTYTNTSHDAVKNGISMRRLTEKDAIALCLVQLAKGYEHKTSSIDRNEEFILECAETALKFDSLCLSAMLLKVQVLERLINYEEEGYSTLPLNK